MSPEDFFGIIATVFRAAGGACSEPQREAVAPANDGDNFIIPPFSEPSTAIDSHLVWVANSHWL